jgi:predicted O-methyltransferase YrrM
MYSSFQLALKYIRYFISASNGKGHGIHSPFVYDLVSKAFNSRIKADVFKEIEQLRSELLKNDQVLSVRDFGAGSSMSKTNQRKVSTIASASLKPKKYAALLYKIIRYFQPGKVVELGTSLGITTCYIATAVPHGQVITCEGDDSIADIAQSTFNKLGLENIEVVRGDFDVTINQVLADHTNIDLVYIDGNHREAPTLRYFNAFYDSQNLNQVMIFDDIHWSEEMESAWHKIKADDRVTLTIDLFFIGLVLFKPEIKSKQHFTIRY